MESLNEAVAQIKNGVEVVGALLGGIAQAEADARKSLVARDSACAASLSKLEELRGEIKAAGGVLASANAEGESAAESARAKAAAIVSAAKEESARVIADARASADAIFAQMELDRAGLVELQGKVEAARAELGGLRENLAQAKANFLKAVS